MSISIASRFVFAILKSSAPERADYIRKRSRFVIDEIVRKLGAVPEGQHIRAWERRALASKLMMSKGYDAFELCSRVH
jgi:hypothetical protein